MAVEHTATARLANHNGQDRLPPHAYQAHWGVVRFVASREAPVAGVFTVIAGRGSARCERGQLYAPKGHS